MDARRKLSCAKWLLLPVLIGFACAPPGSPRPGQLSLQTVGATQKKPYLLQVGDLLSVKFYFNPELNEDVIIRPDGMISLQLVGDVAAAGQSPQALAGELRKRYKSELAKPRVSVIVRELGGQRVYVGGEVGRQGVVALAGGLTVFQAIQDAGGLLPTAQRKQVVLIRRGPDGRPAGYSIDLRPVASGSHPEQDILLRPYDVVFVPRSNIADVDLFVDQYIRKILPITPGFAVTAF